MISYNIKPIDDSLNKDLIHKINTRTKPVGSLGKLERIALQVGRVQNTLAPILCSPHHILFAADHGIVEMGVSPCSKDVTQQMVYNFLEGGAAINVFCRQHGIEMKLVDAGVCYDFKGLAGVIDHKIAMGTKNYYREPAMSKDELLEAFRRSGEVVQEVHDSGCNVIGFGEMGIGNTSSASIIMSLLCNIPLSDCVGPGAGLDQDGVNRKLKILSEAVGNHDAQTDPFEVLRHFGGLEVAMMTGGMLKAAELGMIVLVDGFIATASYIVAQKMNHHIKDYAIFCHLSQEGGHKLMLDYLGVEALLDLNLRLGEGTAVALAYPLIQSSMNFLNQMASFEGADVELPVNL